MDFSEQTGEIGSFRMFRLIKIQSFNEPSDSRMNLQQTEINQRHNKFPIAMVETHTNTRKHIARSCTLILLVLAWFRLVWLGNRFGKHLLLIFDVRCIDKASKWRTIRHVLLPKNKNREQQQQKSRRTHCDATHSHFIHVWIYIAILFHFEINDRRNIFEP